MCKPESFTAADEEGKNEKCALSAFRFKRKGKVRLHLDRLGIKVCVRQNRTFFFLV